MKRRGEEERRAWLGAEGTFVAKAFCEEGGKVSGTDSEKE